MVGTVPVLCDYQPELRSYAQISALPVLFPGWRIVRKENNSLTKESKVYYIKTVVCIKPGGKMKAELSLAFLVARKVRSRTESGMKRENAQYTYMQYYTVNSKCV